MRNGKTDKHNEQLCGSNVLTDTDQVAQIKSVSAVLCQQLLPL